ncbi:hydroxyacylglutathione hydrolase [Alsobacter metallidurans]|uniref:Hydroxyacylglutathione hydrolase n=1 Tax=Alsobacter metallidurans TaxID=340221 RepID=A0A917IBS8_9HYPH|nr:hydroxyacylglutathione hydrolase [Alsobacter metallidurans]GGH32320.1 hydroxyacylglutathione hydrolase [Alsobacter metallidurans]
MPAEIRQFLIGSDNFGVLIHDPETGATATIDACEDAPIQRALDEAGWKLTHILVTHHHDDHIAGIPALKARSGARVIGPARDRDRIPGMDRGLDEGDTVIVGAMAATVIDTPGHTANHINFHFAGEKILFSGDTLFSLGCGRLFEGTPAQMWTSLQKLAALPDDTRVYCGHEYTLSNARFALTVDPDNAALRERAAEVEQLRAAGSFTLPTTIGREKATNPFLRAADPAVAAAVGMAGRTPLEVFTELRERKNRA